ncbi:hypothetical protein BDQ17DRAFT_1436402 [Cyathus striatus]|nr:hypothetical protein BDQ17DRAFT_1436402 [Cyathus striatus]
MSLTLPPPAITSLRIEVPFNNEEQCRRERDLADQRLKEEVSEWNEKHGKIADSDAREMRCGFISHGLTLLELLEIPAELHPATKVLVKTFKNVLLLAKDCKENDERVSSVFFAKIDMLSILNEVSFRDPYTLANSKEALDRWSTEVNEDMINCAKVIEIYCHAYRVVKYVKSHEWKEKFKGFIHKFKVRKGELHFQLSLRANTNLGQLHDKFDKLSKFVEDRLEWESKLLASSKSLGLGNTLDNDIISKITDLQLAQLVASSGDQRAEAKDITPKLIVDRAERDKTGAKNEESKRRLALGRLRHIRAEIEAPLNAVLKKYEGWFARRLALQTKQLEDVIIRTGRDIVHELSGPYDRLKDEGWMFCVESGIFVVALFEHFLDKFSGGNRDYGHINNETSFPSTPINGPYSTISMTQYSGGGLLKSASATDYTNHPDAWTLDYFITFRKFLCREVDTDSSGFIRISEVNDFTKKQRKSGMTLPQWCAYCAAGWQYEIQIYQIRIQSLLECLGYQQLAVLPQNREYVSFVSSGYLLGDLAMLARNTPELAFVVSEPLKNLVHKTVQKQDSLVRDAFLDQELGYYMEPDEINQITGNERSVESRIERIQDSLSQIRRAAIDRVSSLKEKLSGSSNSTDESLNTFYGGLFKYFDMYSGNAYRQPRWSADEIKHLRDRLQIMNNYKIPSPSNNIGAVLSYKTWESYKETLSEDKVPENVPITWGVDKAVYEIYVKSLGSERKSIVAPYHAITKTTEATYVDARVAFQLIICATSAEYSPELPLVPHVTGTFRELKSLSSALKKLAKIKKCVDETKVYYDGLPMMEPLNDGHYWWHTLLCIPGSNAKDDEWGISDSESEAEKAIEDVIQAVSESATAVSQIKDEVSDLKNEVSELKEKLGRMESALEKFCKFIEEKV